MSDWNKKWMIESAQSLPKALDALKESIEETDRKAAANIKAKVNKWVVETFRQG